MSLSVDLNSDMGEGFGPWKMGDDASLLDIVSSANIACGFHAGDADHMLRCMQNAVDRGVEGIFVHQPAIHGHLPSITPPQSSCPHPSRREDSFT